MKEYSARAVKIELITPSVCSLTLDLGERAVARAGQFLNIATGDGANLLRRPIAICKIEGNNVTVCFQIKGDGTKRLAKTKEGDILSLIMPLGNGFFVGENEKRIALVGGGVGIFPMVSVLRQYADKKEIYSYMGFKNKQSVCMEDELLKGAALTIATDDGSRGLHMNAVQAFERDIKINRPDVVLSCGPAPMLRALKAAVNKENIPCYVSLEERMGCGIGACLVCVCDKTDGKHARVCKDGPVFDINEVIL